MKGASPKYRGQCTASNPQSQEMVVRSNLHALVSKGTRTVLTMSDGEALGFPPSLGGGLRVVECYGLNYRPSKIQAAVLTLSV